MKLFMAIQKLREPVEFFGKTGLRLDILISYFYAKGVIGKLLSDYRHMFGDIFLDSGAYSAYKSNFKITAYDYAMFVNRFGGRLSAVFNLDDNFDDPDYNRMNQVEIESFLKADLRITPVLHDNHDPFSELQSYVDMGHDLIAVGSNRQVGDDFFQRVAKEHPQVKLHMFGKFNRDILFKHKPYSADAATFIHHARMGSIYYYDPIDMKEYTIYLGGRDKDKLPSNAFHFNRFHHKVDLEQFLWGKFKYRHEDMLATNDDLPAKVVNMYFFKQLESLVNTGTADI